MAAVSRTPIPGQAGDAITPGVSLWSGTPARRAAGANQRLPATVGGGQSLRTRPPGPSRHEAALPGCRGRTVVPVVGQKPPGQKNGPATRSAAGIVAGLTGHASAAGTALAVNCPRKPG